MNHVHVLNKTKKKKKGPVTLHDSLTQISQYNEASDLLILA